MASGQTWLVLALFSATVVSGNVFNKWFNRAVEGQNQMDLKKTAITDLVQHFLRGEASHSSPDSEPGYAENCGPKGNNMTFSWRPKFIDPHVALQFILDMTALADFHNGSYELHVYIPEVPDPIFSQEGAVTCGDINKIFPAMCPMKKGDPIAKSYTYRNTANIPSGNYGITGKLFNSDRDEFLCFHADMTVLD